MLTRCDRNITCSLTPSYKGKMYGRYDVFHLSGMVVSMSPQCLKAYGGLPGRRGSLDPGSIILDFFHTTKESTLHLVLRL